MKPKKWTDVYPHGTKEGDEELKFFIALARNPKYQWRSTSAIAKEAGLTRERVEEIINKYYKKGMVFQNPKNEDQWGYWERVPEMLPKIQKSISQKDHDERIGKLNKDACNDDNQCCGGACNGHDPVSSKVKKDGSRIFYIDIKNKNFNAEKFMQNLKEQFRKKKLEKLEDLKLQVLAQNPQVMGVPVEERWNAPISDEDGWYPIRPGVSMKPVGYTNEEMIAFESERAWELDM